MQMRHFRYFIAAAEEGSFLRAAGRLRVAQPSLSRQIRDLERQVGVRLFERLPRGVRLTPAGDAFLREARQTMESAARAVAIARREGAADRMLRIGHGTLFYYAKTAATLLAMFRAAYPESHVTIRRMNETQQRAALRERRIDVAIGFTATPTVQGFSTFHLADAEIRGVVLASSHPLAQQEQVSLADLHDMTWLRTSHKTEPELYETAKAALLHRGLSPMRERPRPRDPAVAGMHVAAGDTWMLATDDIGRMYTEGNPALVYRHFIEPPIPCWISILSLPDARSLNVERLLETARQMPATSPPAADRNGAP
jgi:DNA-binding transcriptional LysR family regulator